jgi:uncharacterized DUF497 family protein
VFTVRGNRIRVVHARDMNRKERTAYGKAQGSIETDSDV